MAVDLIDFVGSLKREVEPPGAVLFAGVTDAQWVGYLSDAFWEARLDGFLEGFTLDTGATADDVTLTSPTNDMAVERGAMALVILYAGVKVLRNRILNMTTSFRAKAGPVEFEQESGSATVLAEMLKQLKATKDRILENFNSAESDVLLLDAYSTRLYSSLSYYGGLELTEGNG